MLPAGVLSGADCNANTTDETKSVLIGGKNLGRHWLWLAIVALVTVLAVVWYAGTWHVARRLPGGSSPVGICCGVAAGLIILFEFLLWPRKYVRAWRIGSAQSWLRAHIWLGLLSLPLAVLHSGFSWGGHLSAALMLLFLVVIASGVYGLAVQQWLPRMMLEYIPAETIYSQIEHVSALACRSAEELVLATCGPDPEERSVFGIADEREEEDAALAVGAVRSVSGVEGKVLETRLLVAFVPDSDLLRDTFYEKIAPYLLTGDRSRSGLGRRESCRQLFRALESRLPMEAAGALQTLADLCDQRRQYDAQARMHVWLHAWLWIHAPLSVALLILLALHAFVALKYSGVPLPVSFKLW
jgi:hypothetical protein